MALMQSGEVIFVDTRKPAEMRVSMLPNAITEKAFLQNTAGYTGKTIVVYCTISYRSGIFAKEMVASGAPVYPLQGGLLAWVLEGGKVYHADRETTRIHVFDKRWDCAPAGYETVMFGFFKQFFRVPFE